MNLDSNLQGPIGEGGGGGEGRGVQAHELLLWNQEQVFCCRSLLSEDFCPALFVLPVHSKLPLADMIQYSVLEDPLECRGWLQKTSTYLKMLYATGPWTFAALALTPLESRMFVTSVSV